MQERLIVWAVVLAIVFIAAMGLRRLRKQARARAISPTPRSPAAATDSDSDAVPLDAFALAQRLDPVYEACAHPSDLLGRPEFEHGVSALCASSVPLEPLINYAIGSNDCLGLLAAEALARRSDAASAVPRVAAYLIHANVWRAFFILRVLEKHAQQPVLATVLVQARSWWARNPIYPAIISAFAEQRIAKGELVDLASPLSAQPAAES